MTNEIKAKYLKQFKTLKEELCFFNDMFQDLNEPTDQQLEQQYQLDLINELIVDDGKKQNVRIYLVANESFVYISNDQFLSLQDSDLDYEYMPF